MNKFLLGRLVIVGTLCSCMLLPAISVQAAPRGARLLVRSYFSVTNSDDGALDRDVEVFGTVNYNGSTVWSVASKNAIRASEKDKDRNAFLYTNTKGRYFNVIFNDSKTWNLVVTGFLNDYDKASKNDAMWNPFSMPRIVNLKQINAGFPMSKRSGLYTLPGDHDSESADLVMVINWAGDIN